MKKKFNVANMRACYERCMEEEGILLQSYNDGFRELLNFFGMLGTGFSFVSSDVADKVRILDEHCNGARAEEYRVLLDAMKMEKKEKIAQINTAKFASASRTALRLHRAMEFIAKLFLAICESEVNHIGKTTKEVYQKTLAKFHPFYVRKPAEFAMVHAIPYRETLLTMIGGAGGGADTTKPEVSAETDKASSAGSGAGAGGGGGGGGAGSTSGSSSAMSETEVRELLTSAAQVMMRCHAIVEQLYTDQDMHGLP